MMTRRMDAETRKNVAVLKKELKADDHITGWKITVADIKRLNIYVTKGHRLEDILEAERNDVFITLYKRKGDKVGESTLPIKSFREEDIRRQIREGLVVCTNSLNKGYTIAPRATSYPKVEVADQKILDADRQGCLDKTCMKVARRILRGFERQKGVRLSSLELHTSIHKVLIINSKGVKAEAAGTRVHIENIITAFKKKDEQEYFNMATYRRLSDIKVKDIVRHHSLAAKHVLESGRPKKFSGSVLLSGEAIHEFFTPELSASPLVMHAFAKVKHMSMSRYKIDESIALRFNCDKPTIYNNPLLDHNISSMPFDGDGVRARKLLVIKDGVFRNYIASKRYADYMGVEPTGPLGVFEMKPGSKTKASLYKSKYKSKETMYEIVSFSSFVPNWISGDFAAEIRLGYIIKKGKKMPFKGGMFVGNMFDMVKDMWLSKETAKMPGYHGPAVVRFEKGSVSGD